MLYYAILYFFPYFYIGFISPYISFTFCMIICISVTVCTFQSHPDDPFLIVGTAQDVVLAPRNCSNGFLHVYKFTENGTSLELVHKVCNNFFLF